MLQERREDEDSRDRLDELEKHWRATADWLRMQVRRVWIGFTVVAIFLLALSIYIWAHG